jgi:uncharacterized membrane protein
MMRTLTNRTAKNARRKLCLTLLCVLCLSGLGAYAVYAAAKADFSIATSPSSQTVTQGQSTTYTVTVTRANGFADPVTLSVSGLPSGATGSWKLSNGTSSNIVPSNQSSATLTVQTAASTPTGTTHPVVTATSGKLSHTTSLTLVVQPAAQPNFALAATPASQTVVQGDQTSYGVSVSRTGGFDGAVSLSVSGLPKNAIASWSPSATIPAAGSSATLQVQTAGDSKEGNYTLTVTGTGTIGSSSAARSATVTLVVQKNQDFQITGDLGAQLVPGRKAPLNLSLSNPNNFAIQVTSLAVAVEEATSKPGCSGTQNFKVTQIPAARYPITMPQGQAKTLSQLGVSDTDKPQVEMLDRPLNQDACMTAAIKLDYSGSASK